MAIVTLVVLLIIGAVSAQQQPNGADVVTDTPTPPPVDLPETGFLDKETLYELLKIFEKDGFVNVTTVPVRGGEQEDEAQRKKRSAGFYGGGGGGCGSHPVVGVRFSSCFTPGRVVYQNNHIVHNYYRTGGYGNCMNYFNALPLASVHPVSGGYSGQLFGGYGRTYTVSSCRSCYGGYSGIGIRCNNAPYSYLSRQFVFRPSVNRVNVNNYNYGGGYGGGFGGGFGGYGGGYGGGFGGYGGGYGGSYGGYAGGVAVAAAPVAVAAAPVAVASAPVAVAAAPVAVGGGGGCYGGGCGGGYAGGCHGSHC